MAERIIDTGIVTLTIISDEVVVVRARVGVSIDGDAADETHKIIAEAMAGDYAMIIDREADYSLLPVAVFNVLNRLPRLKVIAIVARRPTSVTIAAIDKALCKKPLQVFDNLAEAESWVKSQMALIQNGTSGV